MEVGRYRGSLRMLSASSRVGLRASEGPAAWKELSWGVRRGEIYGSAARSVSAAVVSCESSLLGPLLSDGKKQQLGRCCFRLLCCLKKKKKNESERGENSTKSTGWHWRGGRRSCGPGRPTLCHSADESFLLLSNHAWNAACHLGYFCYLSLSVPQC